MDYNNIYCVCLVVINLFYMSYFDPIYVGFGRITFLGIRVSLILLQNLEPLIVIRTSVAFLQCLRYNLICSKTYEDTTWKHVSLDFSS